MKPRKSTIYFFYCLEIPWNTMKTPEMLEISLKRRDELLWNPQEAPLIPRKSSEAVMKSPCNIF